VKTARRLRRLAKLVTIGVVVAAVAQEIAKPAADRTWHGRVLGKVPYDFRLPTWERVRSSYWNPDDQRLFTDRVLGVGWAVNLHRASLLLEKAFRALAGEQARPIRLGSSGGSTDRADQLIHEPSRSSTKASARP
jgi:hypothetical protein